MTWSLKFKCHAVFVRVPRALGGDNSNPSRIGGRGPWFREWPLVLRGVLVLGRGGRGALVLRLGALGVVEELSARAHVQPGAHGPLLERGGSGGQD